MQPRGYRMSRYSMHEYEVAASWSQVESGLPVASAHFAVPDFARRNEKLYIKEMDARVH